MKMNYHLQTNRKIKKINKAPLFVLFFLLFVGFFIFKPLEISVKYLGSGIARVFPVRNIADWFVTKNALLEENRTLKQQIAEAESKIFDRDILFEENQKYKQITDGSQNKNLILAKVLLRPGFSPYDTVVIERGSRDGIFLGDVAYFNSLAIGEVSEVGNSMSKVTLYSSGGKTFPVNINENKIEVEAVGLGGGTFEIMIPNNIKVEKGEIVTFANNPSKVAGVVEDIGSKNENDTFQRILFSLPININSLDFISIEHK